MQQQQTHVVTTQPLKDNGPSNTVVVPRMWSSRLCSCFQDMHDCMYLLLHTSSTLLLLLLLPLLVVVVVVVVDCRSTSFTGWRSKSRSFRFLQCFDITRTSQPACKQCITINAQRFLLEKPRLTRGVISSQTESESNSSTVAWGMRWNSRTSQRLSHTHTHSPCRHREQTVCELPGQQELGHDLVSTYISSSPVHALTLPYLYLTGKARYRLALRPPVGLMRVPELSLRLQEPLGVFSRLQECATMFLS